MDINQKKEQFSNAFVRSIASQLGHNPSRPEVDDDSIDLSLSAKIAGGKVRSPQIDLQLKCTSSYPTNEEYINFRLPVKNYNDLRGEDVLTPRYLFVLVVPEECGSWIDYDLNNISLRGECFWLSLRFAPETSNTSNITVNIPTEQRLTDESLTQLMSFASEGRYI